MTLRIGSMILLPVLVVGCSKPATPVSSPTTRPDQQPSALTEPRKVELLIETIRDLKDATFVRTGQEHGPETAAALLQYRWNRDKEQLKTADAFIQKAATKSSTTGQPYLIRFKDGTEVRSEQYLRKKLEELAIHPE
jgi:hypothetical protein